jgi:hypothetical protein
MSISWETWESAHEQYRSRGPQDVPVAIQNFYLLLSHSKVWATQLGLVVTDPETRLSRIRTDPINAEKVMEGRILGLWNKISPTNSKTILEQLEQMPMALQEDRFKSFLTRLITTLQVNRVYVPLYMQTLFRLEERKAWHDGTGRVGTIGRSLLPLLEEKMRGYLENPTASCDMFVESLRPYNEEERFEATQKWKRNVTAIATSILYGSGQGLWPFDRWLSCQESLLRSEIGLDIWMIIYKEREDLVKHASYWSPAKKLLTDWSHRIPMGRILLLLQNVLDAWVDPPEEGFQTVTSSRFRSNMTSLPSVSTPSRPKGHQDRSDRRSHRDQRRNHPESKSSRW